MTDPIKDRIANLDDHGRNRIARLLGEEHPRIMKRLLDKIDKESQEMAVREAMPPHPATSDDVVDDTKLCWWNHDGVLCLRAVDNPLHTATTAPNSSEGTCVHGVALTDGCLKCGRVVHRRGTRVHRAHEPLCVDKVGHPHDNECECWCHDEDESDTGSNPGSTS